MTRYFKLLTFFALAYACNTRCTNASTGFNDLPDVVKTLIFSKTQINEEGVEERILNVQALGRCAQVCKAWQKPSSSDIVWQRFAAAHFHLGVIPEECYAQYSKTANSILSETKKYKKLLHYKAVIQDELGKKAVILYKRGQIHWQPMIALELLGDSSLITAYLQSISTKFQLNGDYDALRNTVNDLVNLGSRIAPNALNGLG